jgi:hypothetical protein
MWHKGFIDNERTAFEKVFVLERHTLIENRYLYTRTQLLWEGWLERAKQAHSIGDANL